MVAKPANQSEETQFGSIACIDPPLGPARRMNAAIRRA
jgi:hypothetical protein